MFFGQSADHLQKHLPDTTRRTLQKLDTGNGQNFLTMFSMIAAEAKASGTGFETFDTGPTLLKAEDPRSGADEKIEVTVERDDLSGDEDQIELAFHMTRNGKEDTLPFVPRFTFTMKTEADVWRLNEISVTVRLPLADPDFLKGLEERQRTQNEQTTIWAVRSVNTAESSYKSATGSFACDLATLGKPAQQTPGSRTFLFDSQLAGGKKGGYIFVISGCDGSHYKVVAEPEAPASGQRAFCSDEGGSIRASGDGKATTCLTSGEEVEKPAEKLVGNAGGISPSTSSQSVARKTGVQRVRVSQGVTQGMILSRVQPVYPEKARDARVQGEVVMSMIIGSDGNVQSLRVINSASPVLEQAALEAVKQWKYKPYLLNGSPVEVDTTVTVNFTLRQ
jgi:TonB family protein